MQLRILLVAMLLSYHPGLRQINFHFRPTILAATVTSYPYLHDSTIFSFSPFSSSHQGSMRPYYVFVRIYLDLLLLTNLPLPSQNHSRWRSIYFLVYLSQFIMSYLVDNSLLSHTLMMKFRIWCNWSQPCLSRTIPQPIILCGSVDARSQRPTDITSSITYMRPIHLYLLTLQFLELFLILDSILSNISTLYNILKLRLRSLGHASFYSPSQRFKRRSLRCIQNLPRCFKARSATTIFDRILRILKYLLQPIGLIHRVAIFFLQISFSQSPHHFPARFAL